MWRDPAIRDARAVPPVRAADRPRQIRLLAGGPGDLSAATVHKTSSHLRRSPRTSVRSRGSSLDRHRQGRCVWRERQLAVVLVMSAAAPQGASGNKRTFNAHAALLRTSQYQYLSRRYSLQPSTSISHSRFMVAIPHLAPPSTAVAGGRLASASRPSCELKRERKRSLAREVLSSRCSRMQGWPGTRRLRLQSG
jgi:hypothetical protein